MNKTLKKYVLFVVKLSVSSGLLYLVLKKAGIQDVFLLLKNINPWTFAAAVVIYVAAPCVASVRWQLLLPERYSLKRLIPLYLVGSFFNTFLPGLVGGDAVKIYYLYRETGKGTQALASVFMDRYIGFCTMMLVGIAAYPFGMRYMRGSWLEWVLPAIVLAFALASIVIFGLRVGARIQVLGDVYKYFHSYRKKKSIIFRALLLSLVLQLSIMTGIYILALGLGVEVPFVSILTFIPIITTVSTIPISLSGIGLREAASVLLFGTIGVGAGEATAISFAWFLTMSVGGLTGLYEYLRVKDYEKQEKV